MEIIWHGKTCFSLKGNDGVVMIDPHNGEVKTNIDIVALSEPLAKGMDLKNLDPQAKVFEWPGEYESKGVFVIGIQNSKEKEGLVFYIQMDGFRICHLGRIDQKLSEEAVEAFDDVDILLIPVGGGDSLNHKAAHEVIEQIDPRIVIPMNYKVAGIDEEVAGIEAFLKEVGSQNQPQPSLKLKSRSELPEETTMFVVLEPQV